MADDKKEFDIEKYYKNLSRAFKGGSPVFRQRVANKITPPGQAHSPVGTARAFLKSTTNLYSSQMASYGMYSRLARYSDYCIAGTTKIWTIEHGPVEIQKLCEMYPNGERFHVYSYDHKNKKVVIDRAHNPHPTKVDMTYKVNFDGGGCIIANESHEFMLRDGSYKPVKDLKVNDSLMPLYRGKFLKDKEYTWVDVLSRIGTSNNKKWQPEHRYVVEQLTGKHIREDEVVHHKNFNPADNTSENLQLMTEKDHRDYHATLAERNNKAKWSNETWREQHSVNHSKFMLEHNPAERTDVTFEKINEFCKKQVEIGENISVEKLLECFKCSRPAISYKLKKAGFSNFTKYAKTLVSNWKSTGQINAFDLGKARRVNIEFEDIISKFDGQTIRKISKELNTSPPVIYDRIREKGFKNWTDFVHQTSPHNHKIVSIEPHKEMQVYDLTTEIHHNFAAGEEEIWKVNHESSKIMQGFVFISNSEMESNSIITSALDIYSDEVCTKDEHGEMIKIFSHDSKIRKILDAFFYQVLNIDFNLWPWVRNFLKYGDQFLLVDHHPNHGMLQVLPMPVNEVEREEGFDQNDPLAYRYRWSTQGNRTLDPWQVIHFRNGGNDSFMPYGCCLAKDTKVLTAIGIKEIKDIVKDDKVVSFDPVTQNKIISNVLDIVCSGTKPVYRLSTRHNFVDVSKEHKVAVYDTELKKIKYRSVDEIKTGNLLLINPSHLVGRDIKINKEQPEENRNGWWNNSQQIPDFVNEEFAQLFGFLLGDGWIPTHGQSVCFALGEYEKQNNFYISLLEKYSGKTVHLENHNPVTLKSTQVVCNSKLLKTILERMDFEGKAHTKRIPSWVFESSEEIRNAFLQGFYEADGSSFTDRWNCTRYQIEICNEDLAKDLKCLIQTLGYKSGKISKRNRENRITVLKDGRGEIHSQESYYFYYFESKLEQQKKYDISDRKTNDFILEKVVSKEIIKEEEVYDIYVDHEAHNFYANGILVHNSVIESVRRTWRQVVLLEDAVMTYRIVRSPERRVFYIDVGGIDPNDVPQFIEKVKGQLKRNNTVDATTGQLDKRYNPMSIMDDYYIPVRGDMTSTRIESLPGGQYVGDIDDLNYHRDKLFAGLKIPKSYLGYEGEVNARSTLSQEDINFARTIARLQNIVVAELNKMAIIQLWSAGYRGEELMNFELTMASPSIITEIQRLELWRTRFEVASVASSQEGSFDRRFAYKKLFKLSDEEIEEIEEGRRKDKLFDMELESMAPTPPEMPPEGTVPPGEEVPPAPEGGVAAGEAPAAQGEQPVPDAEAPITTAGRDPNQQRIMPNDLKGKKKKRKNSNGLPTNLTQVFNFKKTALDPRDGLVQNMRVGSSPFGESLTMGRMLTENIEETDEEFSKQQLQMRLLRHESLLNQLEGIKGLPVKTSPVPVGAPVEPIEDKEKQEEEDELWMLAQKQDE